MRANPLLRFSFDTVREKKKSNFHSLVRYVFIYLPFFPLSPFFSLPFPSFLSSISSYLSVASTAPFRVRIASNRVKLINVSSFTSKKILTGKKELVTFANKLDGRTKYHFPTLEIDKR